MKKRILIALVVVLALAATASLVWAGGGPNGTFVHFLSPGADCYSYWLATNSGLIHEWRYGDPSCAPAGGKFALHLVFKPMSKFESADCDVEGCITAFPWTFNYGAYTDMTDDEGQLTDFLVPNGQYWVCIYDWTE